MLCGGASRAFRIAGRFGLGLDRSHCVHLRLTLVWSRGRSIVVGAKRRSPPGSGMHFFIPASVVPSIPALPKLSDSSVVGKDCDLSMARRVGVGVLLEWLFLVGLCGVEMVVVVLVGTTRMKTGQN